MASIAIHLMAAIVLNLKLFPMLQPLIPDSPVKSDVEVKLFQSLLPPDSSAASSQMDISAVIGSRPDLPLHLTSSVSSFHFPRSTSSRANRANNAPVLLAQISAVAPSNLKMHTYSKAPSELDFSLMPPAPNQTDLNKSSNPYENEITSTREVVESRSNQASESNTSEDQIQNPSRADQIGAAMVKFANQIASDSKGKVCDVTFLLDASGSMEDNIKGVEQSLDSVVDVFTKGDIDYLFAVVKFKYDATIYPQTKSAEKLKNLLKYKMRVGGDEMAYDAIVKAISRLEFRADSDRYFIVVTDEPFKGNHSYIDVLKSCLKSRVHVNVLGVNDPFQKWLTERTGGIWMAIPE